MRVAILSSSALTSPPLTYGGLEMIAYVDALRLGEKHEVYLVGAPGSEAAASMFEELYGLKTTFTYVETSTLGVENVADYIKALEAVRPEVIIDHAHSKPSAGLTNSTCVFHGAGNFTYCRKVVGISKIHAQIISHALGVPAYFVYGRAPEELYLRFKTTSDKEHFLFLARASPEKGLAWFIKACELAEVKCVFMGDDGLFAPDKRFVLEMYRKAKEAGIEWMSNVPHGVKADFIRRAKAVVVLPQYPYVEVFGLFALEAFLLGTPVITTPFGAPVEFAAPGVHAHFVTSVEELVSVMRQGAEVKAKPEELRSYALEIFNSRKLAYELLKIAEEV